MIIRERLRFPSGFSTAVLISVLHGQGSQSKQALDEASKGGFASLVPRQDSHDVQEESPDRLVDEPTGTRDGSDWVANLRLLLLCFSVSGVATILTYFFPVLRNIPIFGTTIANTWLWTLNPSLAYVGQGIIMGTETTMHMTLGAIVGWAILSPLAKLKGWAPGPVDDWEHGSKGWIVWVSLAIMLVDAVVSLGYVAIRSLFTADSKQPISRLVNGIRQSYFGRLLPAGGPRYALLQGRDDDSTDDEGDEDETTEQRTEPGNDDAPEHQRISNRTVAVGLVLSIVLCIITIHVVFGDLVPLFATVIAVFMALVLSIMGVRALGETDLNPVSGISKLAQLFFALIIPQSNKSSVLINLVAGAVVSFTSQRSIQYQANISFFL